MIYNSLLCLALLAQYCNLRWDVRLLSAHTEHFDLAQTRSESECQLLCMPVTSRWVEHKENIFEGYFSHSVLKMSGSNFSFFFSFLKSLKRDTDQLAFQNNTFRSLKSPPVRNPCYGWNSRLNFTLANCYLDTMLNKFLFLNASSTNGGAAFCQMTSKGRWGRD